MHVRTAIATAGLVATIAAAAPTQASVQLTLNTTADLQNVRVGQTVGFDLLISEVGWSWPAKLILPIAWDPAHWGQFAPVTSPTVIPNPAAHLELVGPPDASTGLAIGRFVVPADDPYVDDRITEDGVVFSFQLQALAEGAGTIGIAPEQSPESGVWGFSQAWMPGPSGMVYTVTGYESYLYMLPPEAGQSYTIVPEPMSMALLAMGLCLTLRRRSA